MMTVQLLSDGHLKANKEERGQKQHGEEWQRQRETMRDGRHGLLYTTQPQADNTGREMFQPYVTTGIERIKVRLIRA